MKNINILIIILLYFVVYTYYLYIQKINRKKFVEKYNFIIDIINNNSIQFNADDLFTNNNFQKNLNTYVLNYNKSNLIKEKYNNLQKIIKLVYNLIKNKEIKNQITGSEDKLNYVDYIITFMIIFKEDEDEDIKEKFNYYINFFKNLPNNQYELIYNYINYKLFITKFLAENFSDSSSNDPFINLQNLDNIYSRYSKIDAFTNNKKVNYYQTDDVLSCFNFSKSLRYCC